MRESRIAVRAAASTGVLVAALGGVAALSGTGTAGVVASATSRATVTIVPQVRHAGRVASQPPTTAECEKIFKLACYEPAQIQQAYNLPALYRQGITGAGTTIVIVDPFGSPTIAHDLQVFDQTSKLPAPPSLKIIAPAGKIPKYDPTNADMVSWAGETSLDVEYAHTVAPGASILLVETPVSETEGVTGFPQIVKAEEYVVGHHLGDVISQSFGATEETFPSKASVTALRGAYIDADQHNVTVLAGSGDDGVADVGLDEATYYLKPVVSWPPGDPLVTGVGGTELKLNAAGQHTAPDVAWNDTYNKAQQKVLGATGPVPVASGGGKSVLFSRPWYQDGVQKVVGIARGVPDISMSAGCDGQVEIYQSFAGQPAGWSGTCGTSEASPLFAGIVALADQVAGHPLGLINPALYAMSAQHLPGIVDVTSGNNTVSFTQGGKSYTLKGFSARPGYDLATGVGTVNAPLFVPELVKTAEALAA
jgi:subtilase family serine protease